MTIEQVKQKLVELRSVAHDPERAHGLEDEIRDDVLAEIAEGKLTAEQASAIAALARTTTDVEFDRWYA